MGKETSGHRTHGMSYSLEYGIWSGLKSRCLSLSNKDYQNYGGRGITVCDRWSDKDGFQNFIVDVGVKPTPHHTLERKDNDGNYEPDNCYWATKKEQANNTRRKRIENFTDGELLKEVNRRGLRTL